MNILHMRKWRLFLGDPRLIRIHTRHSDPESLSPELKIFGVQDKVGLGVDAGSQHRNSRDTAFSRSLETSLQPDFLWTLSNEGIASNCLSSLPEHGLGWESLTPANGNCPITDFSFPRIPNQCRIKILKCSHLQRQYTTLAFSPTATAGVEYIPEAAGQAQKSLFFQESL